MSPFSAPSSHSSPAWTTPSPHSAGGAGAQRSASQTSPSSQAPSSQGHPSVPGGHGSSVVESVVEPLGSTVVDPDDSEADPPAVVVPSLVLASVVVNPPVVVVVVVAVVALVNPEVPLSSPLQPWAASAATPTNTAPTFAHCTFIPPS